MGKAVKSVGKVAKAVNIPYQATKGVVNLARGRNPMDGLTKDAASAAGVFGMGGEGADPNAPPANLDELLARINAQAGVDKQSINAFGSTEEQAAKDLNLRNMDLRKNRRSELASLLAKQADDSFQLSKPEIAESANSAGILASSGYGEALAREKARLATQRENTLAQQALTDVDADIAGSESAAGLGRGYRESALSRGFSLEDMAREAKVAKEIGANVAPSVKPSGKGGMLSGAASGAAAGSGAGPFGTAIGGIAGGILGKSAVKGK